MMKLDSWFSIIQWRRLFSPLLTHPPPSSSLTLSFCAPLSQYLRLLWMIWKINFPHLISINVFFSTLLCILQASGLAYNLFSNVWLLIEYAQTHIPAKRQFMSSNGKSYLMLKSNFFFASHVPIWILYDRTCCGRFQPNEIRSNWLNEHLKYRSPIEHEFQASAIRIAKNALQLS